MKTFHLDCQLDYDVSQRTLFLFNIAVPTLNSQYVSSESISSVPEVQVEQLQSPEGNRLLRIDVPPGQFHLRYLANVDVQRTLPDSDAREVPVAELPADVLRYLLPTRYCEVDALFPLACRKFGAVTPGVTRVQAICQWIRDNIDYTVGTSLPTFTARDALATRAGVCRDFAHLGITFCRALNIPARFVTGYARYADPPPDFHAIFEAYLDGGWYLFDPTELSPVEDLIRIGTGSDASEVAFATFFGTSKLRYLSPLVQAAPAWHPAATLVPLQQPGAGILLAA